MSTERLGFNNIAPIAKPEGATGKTLDKVTSGDEFKKALDQVQQPSIQPNAPAAANAVAQLKFSNHAVDRMKSRGIQFSQQDMQNIENAVAKAAQKGAKEALIVSGDNALIVSVKNKTIVTVMDREAMKNNVFTNIDSTVVI